MKIVHNLEINEDDAHLLKFAKIELDHITNVDRLNGDNVDRTLAFNLQICNVVANTEINDPMVLNALCAKLFELRKDVEKFGIDSDEIDNYIQSHLKCENEEIIVMGNVINLMRNEISDKIASISGLNKKSYNKLAGSIVQRIVYLLSWIPLRTFHTFEDLNMVAVGGNTENVITQSSIAGRIYGYSAFSDVPYISNAITFQRQTDDGFEPYICDESRLFVKYPIKSSHFIPQIIRIDKDEKVFKNDRVKYKKLKKRIVSTQPRFLKK